MTNDLLVKFILTILFSFIIGLEIRSYSIKENKDYFLIGSTRTFLFLGLIGFLSFYISKEFFLLFFLSFFILFSIYYIKFSKKGIIYYLIATLVYLFGSIIITFPIWVGASVFVIIIFALNYKSIFKNLVENLEEKEFETLAKFILLIGVILPLLPKKDIPYIGISYFKIWLVVVVVSSISYASYLIKRYLFKNSGYILIGIFGGLYSSTATTVVLAKKLISAEVSSSINSAIVLATAMMYFRIIVIAYIFNYQIAIDLLDKFLIISFILIFISILIYKKEKNIDYFSENNPLELGTAITFAILFILMIALTKFVILNFGSSGLNFLALIVGFGDIDPFVVSILTENFNLKIEYLVNAIIIAAGSNNILKAILALIFSKNKTKLSSFILFFTGIISILYTFLNVH